MPRIHLATAVLGLLLSGVAPAPAQVQAPEPADSTEARIRGVLAREWEHHLISSGENFPGVSLQREHRGEIAVLLHYRVPEEAIRRHFGWTEEEAERRISELANEGLLRREEADGSWLPTFQVASREDRARYMPVPEEAVREAARTVAARLPEIRRRYAAIPGFRNVPFWAASLLVLSDVLMDNWQIDQVESRFLRAERPLRGGKRYYYQIGERDAGDPREVFGVYGNQMRSYGPVTVGVYGNRRVGNPANFLELTVPRLRERFGELGTDTARVFKERVVEAVVRAARDSAGRLPRGLRRGLESLGWARHGRVAVPVLGPADQEALSSLAALFTDDLLAVLERHRPELVRAYAASPYAREISFEEYLVWWYHLFYSAVTDRLVRTGAISLPAAGITTYLLVSEESARSGRGAVSSGSGAAPPGPIRESPEDGAAARTRSALPRRATATPRGASAAADRPPAPPSPRTRTGSTRTPPPARSPGSPRSSSPRRRTGS